MNQEEKREAFYAFIDQFLDGLYDTFELDFGDPPELYEDEFKTLVIDHASSSSTVNGDVYIDEYTYVIGPIYCDVDLTSGTAKCPVEKKYLIIRYKKDVDEFEEPVYVILSASGKTEDAVEVKSLSEL